MHCIKRVGCKWVKLRAPQELISFKQVYDLFILEKDVMLIIAYRYSRESNHCINIDCSMCSILDTDMHHPLPFVFVTYEEYVTALTLHFNISYIESCVVSSVYELKPDIKEYRE